MKKDWLLVTSSYLSGIGQVTRKYKTLLESHGKTVDIIQYFETLKDSTPKYKNCIFYIIPTPDTVKLIPKFRKMAKNFHLMTICETETVHPFYGLLERYDSQILTPSLYCQDVLQRQFPGTKFKYVPHWVPEPQPHDGDVDPRLKEILGATNTYKFYVVGNVVDHRKQVGKILEAFATLDLPNCQLVLKATCNKQVHVNQKNVIVINGLLDQKNLDYIHDTCHCYVSFSFSEGVGMGCIEAAVRNKPVILTEYGGTKEYVKSPYTIRCGLTDVKFDDFLFQKGMMWGNPDFQQLMAFMKECHEKQLTTMEHSHTKELMDTVYSRYLSTI